MAKYDIPRNDLSKSRKIGSGKIEESSGEESLGSIDTADEKEMELMLCGEHLHRFEAQQLTKHFREIKKELDEGIEISIKGSKSKSYKFYKFLCCTKYRK